MFFMFLTLVAGLPCSDTDASVQHDEAVLRAADVAIDGPALVDFFRKRTLAPEELARMADMVRQLGADSYETRERASSELVARGRVAVPFLKRALTDPDLEISRRAERCLRRLESGKERMLVLSALRLLAVRRPGGTVESLLNYLPFSEDAVIEEDVLGTLSRVALNSGVADPALMASVHSTAAAHRAAAGWVLGRSTSEIQRKAVRPLLKDADPKVRLWTAQGLVAGKDREAIPTLVELLAESPVDLAWQAEDLLCRLAEDHAPQVALGAGTESERRRCRDAWATWWREAGSALDFEKLDLDQRSAGLTLLVAYTGYQKNNGRVWERGKDGGVRWSIADVSGPIDAQVLPGGRVLIAEYTGKRVTERDVSGRILWEYKWPNRQPLGCQRLPNGNTVIASISEIREVTPDGTQVAAYAHVGGSILSFQKLRNGHIVFITLDGFLRELDEAGIETRSFRIERPTQGLVSVEALPGGHFLVPNSTSGRIVEYDGVGKEVRSWPMRNPTAATRLNNGNILACSNTEQRVVEMSPTGEVLWEEKTEGRVYRVRRR